MKKLSLASMLFILGFICTIQAKELTQILNPQFKGIDLSIPKSINFQGYLYRDGYPMDTLMSMWFGIYNAPEGGNLFYQQTKPTVEILNGWFSVELTNIPDSVFHIEGPVRFLEVKAPATLPPLVPRISLMSVGYSFHSITADSAEYARFANISRPIIPPIEEPEIGDYMVTNPKLGNNAVTTHKIEDATIRGIDIAKPCTLQASTSYPGAIFRVVNSGAGDGVEIGSVGNDGFRVMRAGDDGFQVDSAENGFVLYRASNDGLWIARAGNDGIYIDSAAWSGVSIQKAYSGISVEHGTMFGAFINNGGWNAIHINTAANSGVYVDSVQAYGLEVNKAGSAGLKVDTALQSAVNINFAGHHGILIDSCNWSGVAINRPVFHGIHIGNTGVDGVLIENVGTDGFYVGGAGDNGIKAYGDDAGGKFIADLPAGVGLFAHAYNNVATDTAIRAYGRGIATGGWSTGFDNGKEAPCIVSSEKNIIASGNAVISEGKVLINYPEIFNENIQKDIPVRISITPKGDPSGILCVNDTKLNGFEVVLKQIPGWGGKTNITFDWIAIGTLKEPETSAEAKAEWERQMQQKEEKKVKYYKN